MQPAIDISNVCFRYDTREVLHKISLSVPEGAFAAMVGPNGGGKTTLLKLIIGLLTPRYGSIAIFGKSPQQMRRAIGYVPQFIHFDPDFPATALDITLMGRIDRHPFGIYSKQDKDIARDCLKAVNLSQCANRPFAQLSGGERQRVLIAQTLACQPHLLLLDEPCANLDPDSAIALCSLLKQLNESLTILMVSHNLEVVSTFVSHVICINSTADMHKINEMHCDPLTGSWMHISHNACPVSTSGVLAQHKHEHDDI